MEHFNKLSPEVAELLAVLAEECGEVVQRVGKILRHGIDNANPYNGVMNRASLEDELTDIMTVVDLLSRLGILNWERINDAIPAKLERLGRPGIMHHSSLLKAKPCRKCWSTTDWQKGPPSDPLCLDEGACLERVRAASVKQGFEAW